MGMMNWRHTMGIAPGFASDAWATLIRAQVGLVQTRAVGDRWWFIPEPEVSPCDI